MPNSASFDFALVGCAPDEFRAWRVCAENPTAKTTHKHTGDGFLNERGV